MDAQQSRRVGIADELFSSLRFTQANIEEMGNVATVVYCDVKKGFRVNLSMKFRIVAFSLAT